MFFGHFAVKFKSSNMDPSAVENFYSGKTVFFTGATGFLGRVLLAKLMRIGNLKQILLLSRPKKGKSNDERLEKILSGFLFEEMEKFDKNFKSKLKIVNGDMEIEDMCNEDREYINEHVDIVIHLAATRHVNYTCVVGFTRFTLCKTCKTCNMCRTCRSLDGVGFFAKNSKNR